MWEQWDSQGRRKHQNIGGGAPTSRGTLKY